MSELACQGETFITLFQGLIGVAKKPERKCRAAQAENAGVLGVNESMRAVSLRIMKRDALIQMFKGNPWFSKV